MKTAMLILLLLLTAVPRLGAADPLQIEKELQQSAPGLPEFRVFQDNFGIVRSVRTLPEKKHSGRFSLAVLKKFPQVAMLDLSGLAEVDLTGLEEFRELRTLKVGALHVKGIEKISSKSLLRLDLAETDIRSAEFLKNFPALRNLLLPPGVTDITPLRERSFRALSAPGVSNLDAVCAELNIQVNIRTGRHRRHPAGEAPPAEIERDEKGNLVAFRFWRLRPPVRVNSGFTGMMFPEEISERPVVPPEGRYPALKKIDWKAPFSPAVFGKDAATLRELDLRACRAVAFRGEKFPELRELRLSGPVSGLETLQAPKLTRLYLERVEGLVPGARLPRPRSPFQVQDFSRRPNVPLVALPPGLKLDLLRVIPVRDEFDFDSLRRVGFRRLECFFPGRDPAFLAGTAVECLHLTAPHVTGRSAAILGALPLRELKLRLGDGCDYSFLRSLRKLETLSVNGGRGGRFDPAWLTGKPLRILHLQNPSTARTDWNRLRSGRLRELILSHVVLRDLKFLGRLKDLESLALENCVLLPPPGTKPDEAAAAVASALCDGLTVCGKLRNLRVGRIGASDWNTLANSELPLERLKVLKLENLSVCIDRADWVRCLPTLRKLKIDDISRNGIPPESIKCASELKVLTLTNIRPRPDRWVPESRALFRRPVVPSFRPVPDVAEKCYVDVPGGFNGGFLSAFPGIRGF
ncbi:MAG: hypothetical protein IJT50_09580 [Lentisphaeria bacterium]|nr:hypothetical protein [Lentisphaeria bacterium]